MDLKGIQKTFRNTHAQHRPYAKTLTLAMKTIKQGGQRVDEPALIIVWMRGVRSSTREYLNFFSLKKRYRPPKNNELHCPHQFRDKCQISDLIFKIIKK